MTNRDALLERLAELIGISSKYRDAFEREVETTPDTRDAIMEALGLNIGSDAEIQASVDRLKRLRSGLLPAVVVVSAAGPGQITLRNPSSQNDWALTEENGTVHKGSVAKGARTIDLPTLPVGYHHLQLGEFNASVIAAPDQCWQPDALEGNARLWGAAAQVYSLRSDNDLGIGDYTDVAMAAEGVGELGGSFLGLSPVHALFAADRSKISPYSPSSRLFLESIYIDPRNVEGFAESGAQEILDSEDMQERVSALQNASLIDYAEVWAIKRPLLDALWHHFQRSSNHEAFDAFRKGGGSALEAHATFETLSEHFREQGIHWIGQWPEPYRSVHSDEVRQFRISHADRISFHAWLQWQADRQLAQAAERGRDAGLSIGLYRDLAVGADGGGSEIWATPERFSPGLAVGAPPDPLGPQGQNWGLPPFNPLTLEEQGLAAFRDLVASNMRHAGAIRIDHAFQLQRLFLIPSGAPASQGAYVDYPFEAMLAVLRVESHRARCLVIAEDLGTAPTGFSDAIMKSGMLSYRVLPFEREEAAFNRPDEYPRSAMAVITTHDLPTFIGWWRGLDIDLRQTLAVFDPANAGRERSSRESDKREFAKALAKQDLLTSPDVPHEPPLEAAVRYLARTSCALTALQIEDASGELNQPNMPGMDASLPNWRRRLSNTLESIMAPNALLPRLSVALAEEGRNALKRRNILAAPPPRATYRLQFHKDFTFHDAATIVPYLAQLGISHVYASPIQAASPGSTHGYDIVDHSAINPELGGEEGFRHFSDVLKAHGLKLLLDIVPNHMGIGGQTNSWWLSVLEWGRRSPHADAFDIDWRRPGVSGKIIVPFLGSRYGEALEKGELQLRFDENEGSFSVWHWEHRFPVCPLTYPLILDQGLGSILDPSATSELRTITEQFRSLDRESGTGIVQTADQLKKSLAEAYARPDIQNAIVSSMGAINGTVEILESFDKLHRLLEVQAYRLAYWRVASSDINYRRFFDINNLAGIRVESPEVFERTHELILRLVKEDRIHGLRIDHIDGLADPEGYSRALQAEVGPGFYVVVEKILEPGEALRPWPVAGTSGYDALNLIDGVLVHADTSAAMDRIYRETAGIEGSYEGMLREAKLQITQGSFASELEVLVSDIKAIADANRSTRDHTAFALRQALVEIIASFPVYRTYLGNDEPSPEDVKLLEETISAAKHGSILPDQVFHKFIADALLGHLKETSAEDLSRFRRRFQQLTGPVMAKSLEDTLFYRYGRLIALNEVGGDPGHFGISPEDFHKANIVRKASWPHAMITTATHDTKRGEDARARLLALSEIPDEWETALEQWRKLISPHLSEIDGLPSPDANDQVILLQALLGAWPLDLLEKDDAKQLASFKERMEGYVIKALREAKRHTSWVDPREEYEYATLAMLRAVLEPKSGILDRLRPLAQRLSVLGMLNGLSRTVLKMTLPGVPDIYQGTEFWDFSLVDPDNRRPVDYGARAHAITTSGSHDQLLAHWQDGRIKQYMLAKLLQDREQAPKLYSDGNYRPLEVQGSLSDHLLAYVRHEGHERIAVIVPRLWASLVAGTSMDVDSKVWSGTSIVLPHGRWMNVITGSAVNITSEAQVADILAGFPFAVLRSSNGSLEKSH
ncbi:malto-oligosyltrehalose synthase [Microvirga sp. 2YAF29]|uniref:malto-oligosyltrehalose synthase n=1 Tax=Microvirga sp. 2YAF29 TaxID=3233031 RepID=UPI003F9CBB17